MRCVYQWLCIAVWPCELLVEDPRKNLDVFHLHSADSKHLHIPLHLLRLLPIVVVLIVVHAVSDDANQGFPM